jgi:hypothetical protein
MISGMPVAEISGWLLACATEVFTDFDGFRNFVTVKLAVPVTAASHPTFGGT